MKLSDVFIFREKARKLKIKCRPSSRPRPQILRVLSNNGKKQNSNSNIRNKSNNKQVKLTSVKTNFLTPERGILCKWRPNFLLQFYESMLD